MSFYITKMGNSYNSPVYMEYILDSASDITELPGIEKCAPGSKAITSDGTQFVLSPSGDWTLHGSTNSGGNSGSITIVSGKPTILYSNTMTISSTSTSGDPLFEIETSLPSDKTFGVLYAIVEDVDGQRSGYFNKSETAMIISNGAVTTSSRAVLVSVVGDNGSVSTLSYGGSDTVYGVFVSSFNSTTNKFKIYARYNSSASGIISGTYKVNVYAVHDPR